MGGHPCETCSSVEQGKGKGEGKSKGKILHLLNQVPRNEEVFCAYLSTTP
jgi:hypothetical protein